MKPLKSNPTNEADAELLVTQQMLPLSQQTLPLSQTNATAISDEAAARATGYNK
jgi:hypothetical protein